MRKEKGNQHVQKNPGNEVECETFTSLRKVRFGWMDSPALLPAVSLWILLTFAES